MSEKKKSAVVLDDTGKPGETTAYLQAKRYREQFLIPGGILDALRERRRFFRGNQYVEGYSPNSPKPTLNLVQEGVTKIAAKIVGTKRHCSFISDKDDDALEKLDEFYEHQSLKMGREMTIADSTMVALIDGTSVTFTSFDSDTLGTEGLYKGFLKDIVVPFEDTFWSDPWRDDPQEMRYLGFFLDMEVGAAKELIEGDDKTKALKSKFVARENFFVGEPPYEFDKVIDSDLTRVYVRFFRENGEVYFECATQYVNLTDHPHALNPMVTEKKLETLRKEMEGDEASSKRRAVDDYATDEAKYTLFTDPVSETHEGYKAKRRKFSRYPVSVCIPYPELPRHCILGRSLAAMIIPNQKLYNYCYLLVALIMQYHAMPKWVAKPNALGSQTIDNTPNQVIIDYSSLQEIGGSGFGITRMSSGSAVNSNLLEIGDTIAGNTRFILGFANLEASGTDVDSGYEYAQRMKQINLPLEIPQMHVWKYCGELARTDLMYFTHYIDNAKFYRVRSDAELSLNENYRVMSQNMINTGKSALPSGTVLPKSRRIEVESLDSNFFDSEFDVVVDVEQGIAGSELTESQHFNQIWTYIAQGNLTADKIKMLIQGDPAISRKTRAKISASLEELETSQIAQKDQQIQALQEAIQELQQYMQFSQRVIKSQQAKQKATEQAAADQNKVASELIKNQASSGLNQMSESEVKSNNAKGISGGSFSKGGGNSIYNTGA